MLIFGLDNSKGVIKIFHLKFKKFLEEAGFYKFNPDRKYQLRICAG